MCLAVCIYVEQQVAKNNEKCGKNLSKLYPRLSNIKEMLLYFVEACRRTNVQLERHEKGLIITAEIVNLMMPNTRTWEVNQSRTKLPKCA